MRHCSKLRPRGESCTSGSAVRRRPNPTQPNPIQSNPRPHLITSPPLHQTDWPPALADTPSLPPIYVWCGVVSTCGGCRYVFIALILGAVFYAVPLSLISAELSCALPYDGGQVAWVEETCGSRLGAHNMYWLWVS
jgi:hypothetical protein